MDASGSFISMPVMRTEPARDDDERSKKERQKQLERQLPRMRIADQNRSEQILADAMRTGRGKNSAQRPSELPQPSTARSLLRRAEMDSGKSLNQRNTNETERAIKERAGSETAYETANETANERVGSDMPRSEIHAMKAEDHLLTSQDLHALEERLQCRKNPPSASEILSIMKKLESKAQNQNKSDNEAMANQAEHADLLCSLDFIQGYVGALSSSRETSSAIMEVMESMRGKIMMSHAESVSDIKWQQENILQLISDTDAKCTLRHDAAGHTQVVIEVNEEALRAKSQPSRGTEPNQMKLNRTPATGEDTLPLVVQKSV